VAINQALEHVTKCVRTPVWAFTSYVVALAPVVFSQRSIAVKAHHVRDHYIHNKL
jgi:hypothetical protein